MKINLIIIISLLTISTLKGQIISSDSLVSITESEFDKGKMLVTKRYVDKRVIKQNGILAILECRLYSDFPPPDYITWDYVGDLDKGLRYKIVRHSSRSVEDYFVIDTENCIEHHLSGEPKIYGTMIITCINTWDETGRAIPLFEIWKIEKKGIRKMRAINLRNFVPKGQHMTVERLKVSKEKKIMFEDYKKKYWRIEYPL